MEYSAELHTKRGYTLMFYFPEHGGIEKEEDLLSWELKDPPNRMLIKLSSRQEYNRMSKRQIDSMFPI